MKEVLSKPLPGAPKQLSFSVLRVPFFLEPHYDENKVFIETNRERLIKKWGGKRGWEEQKHRHDLKGRGLRAGIPKFNLDRKTSNTMASHRLIQFVGKKYGLEISEGLYDRLNVYYFVEGHSLNDKALLAEVAASEIAKLISDEKETNKMPYPAPLSMLEILDFLNGNEGRNEIISALRQLEDIGVHGIPKFIIEGKTVIDGAAEAQIFVDVFRDIERRGVVHGGPIFGSTLGIDETVLMRGSHSMGSFEATI